MPRRKAKNPDELRSEQVGVMFTPPELAELKRLAKGMGMTHSSAARLFTLRGMALYKRINDLAEEGE